MPFMRLQVVAIDYLDRENFLRYGEIAEVLRADPGRAQRGEDEYRTLTRIALAGWRVSIHCVRARWTDALHSYDSRRLLTPQKGAVLLVVATPQRLEDVHLFLLDAPVVVNDGVPNALISLSAESLVQVTDAYDARAQSHSLRKALVPAGLWD